MKLSVLPLLSAALLLAACGSGDKKDSKAKSAPGQNPLNAPTDYLGALGKGKKGSEANVAALQLGPAIKAFNAGEGRFPSSLQELVDEGYIRALPALPPGMKADYNPETGEVKIVPAK